MVNEGSPSRLMCNSIPPFPPKEEAVSRTAILFIHSFIHSFTYSIIGYEYLPWARGLKHGVGKSRRVHPHPLCCGRQSSKMARKIPAPLCACPVSAAGLRNTKGFDSASRSYYLAKAKRFFFSDVIQVSSQWVWGDRKSVV